MVVDRSENGCDFQMRFYNSDGSLGEIADRVFHKGIGLSMTDRRSMPHVTCLKLTPDFKGLCAVDSGLDQVKVYDIDYETGESKLEG